MIPALTNNVRNASSIFTPSVHLCACSCLAQIDLLVWGRLDTVALRKGIGCVRKLEEGKLPSIRGSHQCCSSTYWNNAGMPSKTYVAAEC